MGAMRWAAVRWWRRRAEPLLRLAWLFVTLRAEIEVRARPDPKRTERCSTCYDWTIQFVEPCPHCGNIGALT